MQFLLLSTPTCHTSKVASWHVECRYEPHLMSSLCKILLKVPKTDQNASFLQSCNILSVFETLSKILSRQKKGCNWLLTVHWLIIDWLNETDWPLTDYPLLTTEETKVSQTKNLWFLVISKLNYLYNTKLSSILRSLLLSLVLASLLTTPIIAACHARDNLQNKHSFS